MATIKIDRGFTQKIQQKDSSHPPTPHRMPTPPSRTGGWQKWMTFAVVGGVGLLIVIGIGIGIGVSLKPKNSKAKPAPTHQAKVANVLVPSAPATAEPTEALKPTPTSQPAPEPLVSPAPEPQQSQPQPSSREVPLGSPQGLLCEYYDNIPGKLISALRAAPLFPGQPSRTIQVGRFELPEDVGDNFGARMRGFLVPPQSGTYKFTVRVDDAAEFWLSSDDTPAKLRKLVSLDSWARTWDSHPDQQSQACELVAGKRYYLEALMKEDVGQDCLSVGWSGPVSDTPIVIDTPFLQPWSDTPAPGQAVAAGATEQNTAKDRLETIRAPARAAVAEQQRLNGTAYRFAEASQVLKTKRADWQNPEAKDIIDTAILRFETLARLREFVQTELSRTPLSGVWVAFGGQKDVTGASDEGVTVAPGRIVAWDKIPPDQMLRLVNATVPKATGDTATKATLFLAAAVFCKEISGEVDLALKYRERAIALNSRLSHLADVVLGGTPEVIMTEARAEKARAELARLSVAAATLAEKATKCQADLVPIPSLVPGLTVEYWENVKLQSLSEIRKQGILKKAPDSSLSIENFEVPSEHADFYVARIRGFLTPSETGDYTFYIASDDESEFWLSPDENAAKLALYLSLDRHVGRQEWEKDIRKSKPVSLVKGTSYSIEAFLREYEGEDHLAIAWSLTAEDNPKLITSANLLRAKVVGYTPHVQEIRKQIDKNVQKILALTSEVATLREAGTAQPSVPDPVARERANALQKQATQAKDALHEAEGLFQRTDTLMKQFKAAVQAGNDKS